MKKLSLGIAVAAALGFIAGPVSAADIPVKAPPMVMPGLYNWSGLYIGVEGGAVMGQRTEWNFLNAIVPFTTGSLPNLLCAPGSLANVVGPGGTTEPDTGPSACADVGHPLHGGFVGGEAGFNWQAGRWVFGIEGDGQWAELEEALTCATPFTFFTCGSKIRDFETVRGRIGYALGPRGEFLVYVTGGWATARVGVFEGQLFPPFTTFTDWRRHNGFVVGGGAEYGISPWLSVKAEVLYVGLDGRNHCFGNCAAAETVTIERVSNVAAIPAHVKEDFIAARMGLNARFNWGKAPTPVVASY